MFIDTDYTPDGKNDHILSYHLLTESGTIEAAADELAASMAFDRYDQVQQQFPKTATKLKPRVFSIDNNDVKIALPRENLEDNSVSSLLSSCFLHPSRVRSIKRLKLADIIFASRASYPGPRYGAEQFAKAFPDYLLAVTIKKGYTLNPTAQAQLAYELWKSGADMLIEDLTLQNPQLNPFEERLVKTLQMKRRAESELGRKLLFAPNITAETAEMIRRADLAKDHKNDIVLVDVSAVGFASLQSVRRHCHQYILATRPYLADLSEQGIDRTVIAKLARLSGADIYADAGCSVENLDSIKRLHSIMWNAFPSDDLLATGIIHADEAVYDHPDDMFSGVKAMKQTMDAKKEGVFVKEFAKRHRELDKALMKWG